DANARDLLAPFTSIRALSHGPMVMIRHRKEARKALTDLFTHAPRPASVDATATDRAGQRRALDAPVLRTDARYPKRYPLTAGFSRDHRPRDLTGMAIETCARAWRRPIRVVW